MQNATLTSLQTRAREADDEGIQTAGYRENGLDHSQIMVCFRGLTVGIKLHSYPCVARVILTWAQLVLGKVYFGQQSKVAAANSIILQFSRTISGIQYTCIDVTFWLATYLRLWWWFVHAQVHHGAERSLT